MMNHFTVLVVLLTLRTCSTTYPQQESIVFPVTYLNISKDLALQQLLVEWDVGKPAHDAELEMSFEIQVRRTGVKTTVWTEFHNVTLDKSGKPLNWIWDSDFPLECMSHSVRIRSKVDASKIWSQWSRWETVLGLDASNNSGPQIFPNEKFVEEGSDISLCCIGRKGQTIKGFFLDPAIHAFNHTNSQVGLLTVKNVPHQEVSYITVYCEESCKEKQCYGHAGFFLGKPPDTPNDFSCQTQDMRIVTCTWSQGGDTYLYGRHSPNYTLFEEFSQKPVPCTASCSEQCSCSWDIGQQRICNITVTVENPLGKKTATDVFNVTHRIYPVAPFQLWEECTDTEITLYWKHQNIGIKLFCQTEVLHPDGNVEVHNSSAMDPQYVTLVGLQPYTEYTVRVHCGAAKHFWRWSEWSEAQTIRTKEATPSGKLDIWREITPVLGGRNVTLFWKVRHEYRNGNKFLQKGVGNFSYELSEVLNNNSICKECIETNTNSTTETYAFPFQPANQTPNFQGNGRIISYEVTWEKVEDYSKPESISFTSVYNSTRISIDDHSYRISIMAKNNVNYSLPSILIIPRATGTKEELSGSELKEEQVTGADDGIFISWEPRYIYDSYIVDWCNFPMLQPCDLQWKRFGPNTSSALIYSGCSDKLPQLQPYNLRGVSQAQSSFWSDTLAQNLTEHIPINDKETEPQSIQTHGRLCPSWKQSAAFAPGVRYNFRIYGSVADRASLLEKKTGYLKELPPLLDPVVENIELTSNAVTLYWDSYPTNESQPGFVRGYHVYVSPLQEDCSLKGSKKHVLPDNSVLCKYTIENPEEKRYTVKHLSSNTKYQLAVKAFTGGGETPIVNFRYIDTPFNSNILYLLVLLVTVPSLAAAICRWKMKWVQECCCPVIPSPSKSKVLSFKGFKIGSERVLKISNSNPDILAVDSKAEAQKSHPWSQLSSTPTEEKIDGHDSSWIYPKENREREFTSTYAPQTPICFENFAYSSHLAVESNPYQIPETLEGSKPELPAVLYQPHHYFDIFNEDAASPQETVGRKASLRYISQTEVHCIGRRL